MTRPDTISPREAVATYLGEDLDTLCDREYQPGRTGGVMVYSFGDSAYCFCLAVGRNPPKALREAFADLAIAPATGSTADYIRSRGKVVWLIAAQQTKGTTQ